MDSTIDQLGIPEDYVDGLALASQMVGESQRTISEWLREEEGTIPDSQGEDGIDVTREEDDTRPATFDIERTRLQFVDAWKGGVKAFIDHFVDEEIRLGTFRNVSRAIVARLIYCIVLTTPRPILDALIHGDLMARLHNDTDLDEAWKALEGVCEEYETTPGIYAVFLVAKDTFTPPSAEELLEWAEQALVEYAENDKYANKVDNARGGNGPDMAESRGGYRKYLTTTGVLPSKSRSQQLTVFVENLRTRFRPLSFDEQKLPLKRALPYFGFSTFMDKRMGQHAKGTSSNWLMGLFESISILETDHKYTLYILPVYLIPSAFLAELSEIFFAKLGQSMVSGGGGFNIRPPGLNNSSALDVNTDEWEEIRIRVEEAVDIQANREYYRSEFETRIKQLDDELRDAEYEARREKELEDELAEVQAQLIEALKPLPEEKDLDEVLSRITKSMPKVEGLRPGAIE
ncbi:hypothetical protein M409DRAFT_59439 [Zasmidium cellare ATCC 36951]|uniref:Uncharacterized protein n=1 Tax=Zasmidium cellare ATCC 36951 TaxID=1080233 RepID=A0A6A6C4H3_ZASCE|nr:uncharacterized protein M409DRAFT_59439 [Zasmidium cellare ATCC 36951]KAF2161188.1 hypothetical protein M409DRAFT_59439 [Zasmidium cellare ATCC 36951]